MPGFFDHALEGFQRGVVQGQNVYQRSLENARLARQEARQAKLDAIADKRYQQERALAKVQERRAAEIHSLRVVAAKAEARQREQTERHRDAAVDESALEVFREAGYPAPDGMTWGQAEDRGLSLKESLGFIQDLKLKNTTSRHISIQQGGTGKIADPVSGGPAASIRDLDAQLEEIGLQIQAETSSRTRAALEKVRASLTNKRAQILSQMEAGEFDRYEDETPGPEPEPPPIFNLRPGQQMFGPGPGVSVPSPVPPPQEAAPAGQAAPDFDFLDDLPIN